MVNKKAYMKTLEALIAIVLFLIFVSAALVINKPQERETIPQEIEFLQDSILTRIQTDEILRTCLVNADTVCINDTIVPMVPSTMSHEINICNNPSSCPVITFPPERKVYADSIIIQQSSQSAILRLYLWKNLQ
jgi:hypothetical protein